MDYAYIDSDESLIAPCRQWLDEKEIGVDIECENNLHHYGSYISIIQVTTPKGNWVVDALTIRDMTPLIDVMVSPRVLKIFHDVSFDFRILKHQYGHLPVNFFDTQLAALILGYKDIGLGSLLEHFFGITKKQKLQMADWTRRPISDEMLKYAVNDTSHLIQLKERLVQELREKGREAWVQEELKVMGRKDFEYREGCFSELPGIRLLDDRQRAILKRLYDLREHYAKRMDRPVHFILSTRQMMDIARNPPSGTHAWSVMRGVHPIVKTNAGRFYQETQKGMREKLMLENNRNGRRLNRQQRDLIDEISPLRNAAADKIGLQGYLIMGKDQIEEIVHDGSLECLRGWQLDVILKHGSESLIELLLEHDRTGRISKSSMK